MHVHAHLSAGVGVGGGAGLLGVVGDGCSCFSMVSFTSSCWQEDNVTLAGKAGRGGGTNDQKHRPEPEVTNLDEPESYLIDKNPSDRHTY